MSPIPSCGGLALYIPQKKFASNKNMLTVKSRGGIELKNAQQNFPKSEHNIAVQLIGGIHSKINPGQAKKGQICNKILFTANNILSNLNILFSLHRAYVTVFEKTSLVHTIN